MKGDLKRAYVRDIRDRAEAASKVKHSIPSWRRAYRSLAVAADTVDALLARTGVDDPVAVKYVPEGRASAARS